MVGSEAILSGQAIADKGPSAGFTDADRALLDEIGETIVPTTDIPGAKAVGIGAFMTMMVTDCYNDGQYAAFVEGLRKINRAGTALLVVEQQVDRALELADHAVILEHGTVAFAGPPEEALDAMEQVLASRTGGSAPRSD